MDDLFDIIHVDDRSGVFYVHISRKNQQGRYGSVFTYSVVKEEWSYFCKRCDWTEYAPRGAAIKKRKRKNVDQ